MPTIRRCRMCLRPFRRKTDDVTCGPACSAANWRRYQREYRRLYRKRKKARAA